jgi:hypothetical protein
MRFNFVAAPLRGWSPRLAIRIFLNIFSYSSGQPAGQAFVQKG